MIDKAKVNKHLWQYDAKKMAHFHVITDFLNYVTDMSKEPSFILKGGTALIICYGSDRLSEDIDFDGIDRDAEKYISSFCKGKDYWYRVAKDTDTVKRYLIHHDEGLKPLKVEISYRKKDIDLSQTTIKNGVLTYTLDHLFMMKMNAYNGRDRLRDLYDVVFILKNHYDEISKTHINDFVDVLSYKGLEQFDYLINTQEDELIDKNRLGSDFLDVFDKLGLIDDRD